MMRRPSLTGGTDGALALKAVACIRGELMSTALAFHVDRPREGVIQPLASAGAEHFHLIAIDESRLNGFRVGFGGLSHARVPLGGVKKSVVAT